MGSNKETIIGGKGALVICNHETPHSSCYALKTLALEYFMKSTAVTKPNIILHARDDDEVNGCRIDQVLPAE